ncbi:MAG: UDP-N-acetylglucosamine 2-epimerase, partial [Synergistales bacterium]|nr:UDP-N-acetylglucosamine 2-epimerase [Synergistales bacterium]
MKIVSLVGARPQFIKEAIVNREVCRRGAWRHVLVHSGQHYDINMSDVFFRQLEIPRPDHFLGVGSGLHGRQTAEALTRFEAVLLEEKPDAVLVYGDTNTTLAGALAAAKLHIPVVHVEAGLRQSPKTMPEEINRVLTDHVSTRLFCCSDLGATNLKEEGITEGIEVVGDVMYDLYLEMAPSFDTEKALHTQGLREKGFLVVTLHRDFNVDSRESLQEILQGLNRAREETGLEVFLPLHPRTAKRIDTFGLKEETKTL